MRYGMMLIGLGGLIFVGCSKKAQPRRGGTQEVAEIRDKTKFRPVANPHGSGFKAELDDEAFKDAGPEVRLENITLKAPEGWKRKAPQSSFIQAEFSLPRAAEDSLDGRLTLSVAGGSVEANIDRWKDQFGGSPAKAHQEKIDANGLAITVVDFTGVFKDQRGPYAPATERGDFRMIAGIIPAKGQLHFVKGVGPQKTMEKHAESIKAFLATATVSP